MKRPFLIGILASFFFAFTFVLNRSINLSGGYWLWSACLRYLFTLPLLLLILLPKKGVAPVIAHIRRHPLRWLLWSTVGFGLFYAPLTFASAFGASWLVAATWQLTIVAGALLTPLFGKKIPLKALALSCFILVGVALLQLENATSLSMADAARCLVPVLIAAFSYPLGNRKTMELCAGELSTLQRVFGMTLCSMPFWLVLSGAAALNGGAPPAGQLVQSFFVALFSGVIATLLFFYATDLVKHDPRRLALVEATQSGEVVFTLLMGVFILGDAPPSALGCAGLLLIVVGMIAGSLFSAEKESPASK